MFTPTKNSLEINSETIIIPTTLINLGPLISRNLRKMFDVSFRYLKISRNYFLLLSQLIRIYKKNHLP